MIGCVGDDDDGLRYLARLQARGIDVSAVRIVHGETTASFASVDAEGENAIVVIPGANGHVNHEDLAALDRLSTGDVLLTQLEVPLPAVAEAARRAHSRGARVVVNAVCTPRCRTTSRPSPTRSS